MFNSIQRRLWIWICQDKWHVHTLWCWNILPWSYLHSLSKGNLFPLRWLQTLLPSACRVLLGSFAASSVANHVFSCGDSNCPFAGVSAGVRLHLSKVHPLYLCDLYDENWEVITSQQTTREHDWIYFILGSLAVFCAPVRLDCVHLSKQVSEVYCFGIGVCVCVC